MSRLEFEEMRRHYDELHEHESLRTTDQGKLLEFLLHLKNPDTPASERKFSDTENFFEVFYEQILGRDASLDGAARTGQQMVSTLKTKVLKRAYLGSALSRGTTRRISLRKSTKGGYELCWVQASTSDSARVSVDEEQFCYLGNIETAISDFIALASVATKVEDTTVRWNRNSNSSRYSNDAIQRLRAALENNPGVQYKSVTGPIVERAYMSAIAAAFTNREKQLICYRLPQATPLMNFSIFYLPDGSQKVLFGYGRQDGNVEQTAVFSSTNPHLIKEFKRLFLILERPEVSHEITPDDPEFNAHRVYSNEVLVSFPRWPEGEINERISNSREHVSICVAGWSTLGLYRTALKKALNNGVRIRVGVWDADTQFVQAMTELRDVDDFEVTIAGNKAILQSIGKSAKSGSLQIRRLKGWGSLPMMWVDSYLYIGAYWHQGSALLGPSFLLRQPANSADQTVAGFLLADFEAMMNDAEDNGK